MTDVHDDVLALSADIRYVALAHGQDVEMRSRPHLEGASASDSDRYEELLVNPTLLALARQRGEIDCGGLSHLSARDPPRSWSCNHFSGRIVVTAP